MLQFVESSTEKKRFCCGRHDHVSINIERPEITSGIDLNTEQCKKVSEKNTFSDPELTGEVGKKENPHKWEGGVNADYVIGCEGYEWITEETFESHMKTLI